MAISTYLLQAFIDDPEMLSRLRLASVGALLIVCSAVLHAFEISGKGPAVKTAPRDLPRRRWIQLGTLFLIVPAILVVVALVQRHWIDRSAFGELALVADYKSRQIRQWLDEREADVRSVIADEEVIEQVALINSGDSTRHKAMLEQHLETFLDAHGYKSVGIFSVHGELLVEAGNPPAVPDVSLPTGSELSLERAMVESNWQRMSISRRIFSPAGDGQVLGIFRLEMDATEFLDQFLIDRIKRTGETLLVSKVGNRVQFLSPLRFASERLEGARLLLDSPSLPAAIALRQGGSGSVSGLDYRGVDVLAVYQPVPGTDWQLITKIDHREALEPLYSLLAWVGLVALAGVAAIGAMWFRIQRMSETIEESRRDAVLNQFLGLPFVGIAVTSPETKKLLRFNGRFCEMLGYSEEELKALTWTELTHPDDLHKDVDEFNKVLSGQSEGYQLDKRYIRRDGSSVDVFLNVKPVRNAEGTIDYFIAMVQDITEQRAAEARIAASEARLRTLVNTIPDLIWLKDSQGVYLACNPAFERFFGASEAEIVGKTDYDFVARDLADFFRQHDLRAAQAGKASVNEESLTFAQDGYTGVFETIKTPMCDVSGEVIGILGIARDISQRKRYLANITRLQSLYSVLSLTNQTIVRSDNENQLFEDICQNAVEHGGFVMAWIGLLDRSGKVCPVASCGDRTGYLDGIDISVDSSRPSGAGPSGTAIRENRPVWCQDFQHSANTQNWQDPAQQAGIAASAALPLSRHGEVIGTLNVYSNQRDAFDDQAKALLTEMSTDISFALDNIANNRARLQTEERLRLVVEGSRDAPWDWNLETGEYWYSPQWWRLNGYDPAEAFSTDAETWRRFVHPDDISIVEGVITRLQNGNESWVATECRGRRRDGHIFPALIRCAAIRNSGGKLVRLSGTVMDLTEQKQVEDELRRQRNELSHAKWLLEAHLENSPLAVVEWDSEFRVAHWSGGAERIFGWREAEVKGKHLEEFRFLCEGDASLRDLVMATLRDETTANTQQVARHYTRAGEVRHIEWYLSALHNENGDLLSVLALADDITEEVQSEALLRKREHLLDQIFTILPVGVWIADKDGNLQRGNPAIEDIWGEARLVGPKGYQHIAPATCLLESPLAQPSGQFFER